MTDSRSDAHAAALKIAKRYAEFITDDMPPEVSPPTATELGDALLLLAGVSGDAAKPSCGRAGGNCQCTSVDECPRAFAQANQE